MEDYEDIAHHQTTHDRRHFKNTDSLTSQFNLPPHSLRFSLEQMSRVIST